MEWWGEKEEGLVRRFHSKLGDALFGRFCSTWKDLITVRAKKDQGAITLVLDLAAALDRVSLPVMWWAWATNFNVARNTISPKMITVLTRYRPIVLELI